MRSNRWGAKLSLFCQIKLKFYNVRDSSDIKLLQIAAESDEMDQKSESAMRNMFLVDSCSLKVFRKHMALNPIKYARNSTNYAITVLRIDNQV